MLDRQIKILIIDDSPEDRMIFRRYLQRNSSNSYQFYEAKTGEEALTRYEETRPDCILLDYGLPDMTGIMFLQHLQQLPHPPMTAVIILTGSGDEEIAVNAMKQGVQDYLIKDNITPQILQHACLNAIGKMELLQQLHQQNESFRILAENSPDIITRIDQNLRYMYANPAIALLTGLAPERFPGKTNQELGLSPDNSQVWEQTLAEVITSKQAQTIEYPVQAQGSTHYCQTRFVPEFDTQQNVVSILGFTRDITQYREQIQSKDDFISLVSHELRTPLTVTKANIQLAMRLLKKMPGKAQPGELQPALDQIITLLQRAVHRLGLQNRLINDLLDVARLQRSKIEIQATPHNLLDVVQEVVEDQRANAVNRTIELDLSTVSSPPLVNIDQNRIGQVIDNYITNALKYSDKTEPVMVGVNEEPEQVKVWVKDRGRGLSEQDQERIWNRFYQVQTSSSSGLGLGLYICQALIALHGGTVGIESALGEGSTFWFRLPLIEAA
ncbi:hypothetical protein KDH_22190 [Dictyobacter sp. S3.2.2.5]|uniref:histidine kinase n=1 Tax=Dictyobacter halimunensis TaxID=3026934 RepID=A0ABQ6FPZ9_9CHLR|nr:hypothetical protein KDH_22190 [Dictyobacter sp. S3.2.2.5]